MEDLLERYHYCYVPEVPKNYVVRFEEVILEPLPEKQWSTLVADSKEELTPYREANVFSVIFSPGYQIPRSVGPTVRMVFGQEWSDRIECRTRVRDWTPAECRVRVLRRVLCPSLGTPCREEKPLPVDRGCTCSYGLSANRNEIIVRAWGH